MRRIESWAWSSLLLTLLVGCAHTKEVAETPPSPTLEETTPARPAPREEKGHPPLAENPKQLRKEGGTEQITDALRSRGLLKEKGRVREEQLSAAIRKFQKEEDLAATGFADEKTLRKLGLNPKDVERSAEKRN